MSDKPEVKAGQVWREKKVRAPYLVRRRLRILSVGEKVLSHQDGITDITPITYEVYQGRERYFLGGGERWKKSARMMSTFGLHKNWMLEA